MLSKDCTKSAVLFNSKKRILQYIAELAQHAQPPLDETVVFEALQAREKLGSTGIGGGIAIPHGKIKDLSAPVLIFVVSKDTVQFDAIDKQPVDIFCGILIPENQCQTHLSTLSGIARMLSQKDFTRKLRNATSDDELYQLLVNQAEATAGT